MKSKDQPAPIQTFEQKIAQHFTDHVERQVAEQLFNLVEGGFAAVDNSKLPELKTKDIFTIIEKTAKERRPFFDTVKSENSKPRMEAYRQAVVAINAIIDAAVNQQN